MSQTADRAPPSKTATVVAWAGTALTLLNVVFSLLWGHLSSWQLLEGELPPPAPRQRLGGAPVLAFLPERDGRALWLAAEDGLTRFDLTDMKLGHHLPMEWKPGSSAFHQAADGTLWFGTPGTLVRYEPATGTVIRISGQDALAQSPLRIHGQEPGGALWFTSGEVTGRFDPETGDIVTYTDREGRPGLPTVLHVDAEGGGVWLGGNRGLSRFDVTEGVLTRLLYHLQSPVCGIYPQPGDRALWVVTPGALRRFDIGLDGFTEIRFHSFGARWCSAHVETDRNLLWVATDRSMVRFDPVTGSLAATDLPPEARRYCQTIVPEPGSRALWLTSPSGAAFRFDLQRGRFAKTHLEGVDRLEPSTGGGIWWTDRLQDSLNRFESQQGRRVALSRESLDGLPRALFQEPEGGPVWLSTAFALYRWVPPGGRNREEAGALGRILYYREPLDPQLPSYVRPLGQLTAVENHVVVGSLDELLWLPGNSVSEASWTPTGWRILDLAPGPCGGVWVAFRLGGLALYRPEGEVLRLTRAEGLPSQDVHALAPVLGSGGRRLWAATAGGAVRVGLQGCDPPRARVERTATVADGLQPGPVAALAALADGSVFLAFHSRSNRTVTSAGEPPEAHLLPHVLFVPAQGAPREAELALPEGEIRSLAASPGGEIVWAGTYAGLFAAHRAREPGASFQLLDIGGRWADTFRYRWRFGPGIALSLGPRGLWAVVGGYRPDLLLHRPGSEDLRTLLPKRPSQRLEFPERIDDLAFPADGRVVLLAENRLLQGRVRLLSFPMPSALEIQFTLTALAALLAVVSWRLGRRREAAEGRGATIIIRLGHGEDDDRA